MRFVKHSVFIELSCTLSYPTLSYSDPTPSYSILRYPALELYPLALKPAQPHVSPKLDFNSVLKGTYGAHRALLAHGLRFSFPKFPPSVGAPSWTTGLYGCGAATARRLPPPACRCPLPVAHRPQGSIQPITSS